MLVYARSLLLIYLTCFQFLSADPIPRIFNSTKHASLPSTSVQSREYFWCQRYPCMFSSLAIIQILALLNLPCLFVKSPYSSLNLSISKASLTLRSLPTRAGSRINFSIRRSDASLRDAVQLAAQCSMMAGIGDSIYPTRE